MNVKEFVRETLTQILQGVHEAQVGHPPAPGDANAATRGTTAGEVNPTWRPEPTPVEFDLSVEAVDRAGERGWSLEVASVFGVSRGDGDTSARTTSNRVRFSVPIRYPRPGAGTSDRGCNR